MINFRTVDDINVLGKRVLVRADLNVPMQEGKVTDTSRLDRLILTINDLTQRGAKVAILSHFGRPNGQVVPSLTLRPVADALAECLGRSVIFVDECIGEDASDAIEGLAEGGIIVLENLRFHAGEEKNDVEFAADLAQLGDVYINDAFSASHRYHASISRLPQLLPCAAGRFMQEELSALIKILSEPDRPLTAIVGGAKISTKIDLLENLSKKVDALIIGGAMANTFLNAGGVSIGKSLCEHDMANTANEIMVAAYDFNCKIILPIDAIVATKFEKGSAHSNVSINSVPADQMILDVGPKTISLLCETVKNSKTVVWNGPLGAFELSPFDLGTVALAQFTADITDKGYITSIAGGGDTVAALNHAGVAAKFSYVSGAGGAFLEWLEGKKLPGVEALNI
ncbi:MAG: phosphoglycerate kinase [Alphaproteobacteria bacterium]|nr:phosphoglycerate kinase [Alphaproteobacteria bacterium]